MITTLLTHEWKRTRTAIGLATGTAVAAAVVGSLLAATGWVGVSQTGIILAGAAVFGLVPALQLLLAIDYWRSSHGSGGAFTQTLPIRGRRIFAAKLLHMWLVTLAALVLSVVVLTPLLWWGIATANGSDANVFRVVQGMWESISPVVSPLMLTLLILLFVGFMLLPPLQYAFAASIGSEKWMNRLGAMGPVVVYLILYAAMQVLSFAGLAAVPLGIGMTDGSLGLVSWNVFAEMAAGENAADDVMPIGFIPVFLVVALVCLWRTARSWDRKVALA
ncbi:MAG TPA: hypothetical protein H9793_00715 [Candidatus Brevibacterium intestinigallinarum]|nr:hypothetical protein [Candidatus Brevibacterium intestinigallinarum]